jgi:DNA-binding XRE family transcriptional regulator
MKISKEIRTFDQLLDQKYGKRGTARREQWETEFEAFKLGVIIEEARKKRNLTQEQLAKRCGTNKGYISRIENDASDIRLSTLHRIIQMGLGGRLTISVELEIGDR